MKFLRATISKDRGANPLLCWKGNAKRFTDIALTGRDVLAVQVSSDAIEYSFSIAGNLISEDHGIGRDESVSSCMCVASWKRFVNKNLLRWVLF